MHSSRRTKDLIVVLFALFAQVWALAVIASENPIRVGLLTSTGTEGIREVLAAEPGIEVQTLSVLGEGVLMRFDVVVLGSVKGGIADRQWLNDIDLYVRCGGGVLLHHDATGFRGWTDSAFPDLFKGTDRSRQRSVRPLADHPITTNLPPQFDHAYSDHITLDARPGGTVIVVDGDDKPVVVVGSHHHGRVVGNGMITGYAQVDGHQRHEAPTGGERALLIQAIRWLAENRLTQLPAEQLLSRRRQFAADIALRDAAVMERTDASGAGRPADAPSHARDWYTESMLTEQGFIHPPVQILPGRFFMFDGMFTSFTNRQQVGREFGEVRSLVQQMKWAGVTDIITHTGGPVMKFRYRTRIPDVGHLPQARGYGFDYLEVLCKAAHEEGLDVWGFWHPSRGGPFKISNHKDEPYADMLDIKDPRVMDAARRAIDELAERYNTHGNFKGIFLDELWHPFVYDRLEGHVDAYIAFCRDRFGEAPPDDLDLPALFAQGRQWHNPADKWWRRYVLFRNTFTVDFIRQVTEHANARGLLTMPQIGFGFDWFHGHGDTYRLTRAGDMFWTYEHRNNTRYEHYPRNRVITATHSRSPGGYQLVAHLRGQFGSQFALEQTWLPIGFGKNPRAVEIFQRQVRSSREWFGGKPLTQVAVLTNRIGLDLSQPNAIEAYRGNEEVVQLAMSRAFPASMLMVQDHPSFSQYRVLIAPRFALNHLNDEVVQSLIAFLNEGGQLLLLGESITTSREDHTQVVDHTMSLVGRPAPTEPVSIEHRVAITLGETTWQFDTVNRYATTHLDNASVVATNADGSPLITHVPMGKGGITQVHFDLAELLRDPNAGEEATRMLSALVNRQHEPVIRVEGTAMTFSAIRKGDWVVVSFLPPGSKFDTTLGQQVPARGTLRVDMSLLGIKADRFKVINLARDREMMPQGKDWDFFGRKYWTRESLIEQGIDIFMPRDSLEHLELPVETTDDYVRRFIVPRWSSRARSYEHDIIAIAPADAPFPVDE